MSRERSGRGVVSRRSAGFTFLITHHRSVETFQSINPDGSVSTGGGTSLSLADHLRFRCGMETELISHRSREHVGRFGIDPPNRWKRVAGRASIAGPWECVAGRVSIAGPLETLRTGVAGSERLPCQRFPIQCLRAGAARPQEARRTTAREVFGTGFILDNLTRLCIIYNCCSCFSAVKCRGESLIPAKPLLPGRAGRGSLPEWDRFQRDGQPAV
jgi:hypothetical protein